ncbi:MAG: Gfo/Idh/MocA family oxidoreductase [Planctomycetota bacterium]|nr:Gfo/Idh/MocA family oxidoreductase [Planctomycetota bacterium]
MTLKPTRRDVLENTGRASAALALPPVFNSVDETIQIALVGCGGRGSGAAQNALSVKRGPMKLVAMADVFEGQLQGSYEALERGLKDRMDIPEERRFVGFDGYKHAMDCLRPGDVVILATPPAFRWVHFTYAIERGLNVFMEKPVTVDGPSTRRMLALSEQARARKLKVAVGLMSRHSRAMQELEQRVRGGELGEILLQRGYRMQWPIAFFRSLPAPEHMTPLMYQIQRFHSFLWASGGGFNDFFIHIIDQLCWMKDAWPVKAQALGGRHYRESEEGIYVDQNLDTYAVEYTYADGTKMMFDGRCMTGAQTQFASYLHGTKGSAVVSAHSDCGLPSSVHSDQSFSKDSQVWRSRVPEDETNPYQNEWEDFVDALRDDKPYDETPYGIRASLVCNMGRMAAHTGQEISFDAALNAEQELAPSVAELTLESDAPVMPDEDGRYPVPMPGLITDREY